MSPPPLLNPELKNNVIMTTLMMPWTESMHNSTVPGMSKPLSCGNSWNKRYDWEIFSCDAILPLGQQPQPLSLSLAQPCHNSCSHCRIIPHHHNASQSPPSKQPSLHFQNGNVDHVLHRTQIDRK